MLDPDKLLNQIVSAAAEATQSDAAAVFLKDDQGMSLRSVVGCTPDEVESVGLCLPVSILGASGRDAFLAKTITEADFLPTKLQAFLARRGLKSVP